ASAVRRWMVHAASLVGDLGFLDVLPPEGCRGARRIDLAAPAAHGIVDRKLDVESRREVNLAVLVDDPAVLELRDRPAVEGVEDRAALASGFGLLGPAHLRGTPTFLSLGPVEHVKAVTRVRRLLGRGRDDSCIRAVEVVVAGDRLVELFGLHGPEIEVLAREEL